MKVTCPISGVKYILTSPVRGHATHPHPMLAASIKCSQLADWYLADWAKGDLQPVETHLLGIAYLLKLPVESVTIVDADGNLPVFDRFWSANMEKMAKLAAKLEGKERTFKRLPKMVVTADTISNLPEWLTELTNELGASSMPVSEKAKQLNRDSYKTSTEVTGRTISQYLEPEQVDGLVLRALRASPLSSAESKALPVILADWADKVTDFPAHSRTRWHRIVQTVFNADYINQILMSDINVTQVKDIEEHMRLNTPAHSVGTSHSQLLMQRLAVVIPVLEDFSPAIASRRKMNDSSLLDALNGTAVGGAKAESGPKQAGATNKPMTLTERLQLRLKGMGK